ncbi:MAG: phage tail protein [Novosphingobium sp.]
MATLLFSAIGTLVGGRLFGAVGALIGHQVDRAILGGSSGREGPRLKELSVTTSSYGSAIPRIHGRMRTAGTIVWATDLVEHKDKQGGGKGKPSYTTYSYSASFAVALSSRPLSAIGRIWADGNLLRGAAGDMKAGGTMRFYSGHADQEPDALLLAAEGQGACPAYRGLSYVVFEDLQLGDFGNRIPALTFEVFADDQDLSAAQILDGVIDDVRCDLRLDGVQGLSCEGSLAETFAEIDQAFPLDCNVSGDGLSIGREGASAITLLREPAIAVSDDAFGARQGFTRKHLPRPAQAPEILRYYDVDRDYQPGLQRAPGRPGQGQPTAIDLPMAMSAQTARTLASGIARRSAWARQTLSWRSAELDPAISPGSTVTVPGQAGTWRVNDWEWRENGVELALVRVSSRDSGAVPGDPGRASPPQDLPAGSTMLQAFELPWDGLGSGDTPNLFAAVSSDSAGWQGAALFADHGDGQLQSLGASGRSRAVLGTVQGQLSAGPAHIFDRQSTFDVALAAADHVLTPATPEQLAFGANRALVGDEIIQFAHAEHLGNANWRISGLLRGRGGTETAIGDHLPGERFVLLDGVAVALDPAVVGQSPASRVAALGLAQDSPVFSEIACFGISRRPLAPVHGAFAATAGGGMQIAWTRRARGAWNWHDQIETPLNEERESYLVSMEADGVAFAQWSVSEPHLAITPDTLGLLPANSARRSVVVRQQGTHALSPGLEISLAI